MKIKGLFILIIVVILSGSVFALTGSIGNARAVLYPEVGILGTTIERTILVKNVNDVPVNISLQSSEEAGKIVKIIDNDFILEPGTEKKARFNIILKKPGDYEVKINVFFSGLEKEKTGVGLSSTIMIHATKKGLWDENDADEDNIDIDDDTDACLDEECDGLTDNADNENKNPININSALIVVFASTIVLAVIFIFLLIKLGGKKRGRNK